MKKLVVLVIGVSLITLAGFWGGRKLCMQMWPGSLNPRQEWYAGLGLTPQQTVSLRQSASVFRRQAEERCLRICKERLQVVEMMRDKAISPEAIYSKIDEIGQLQVALEKDIARHILEVNQQLTSEQRQRYLDRIHLELRNSIKQGGYLEALP